MLLFKFQFAQKQLPVSFSFASYPLPSDWLGSVGFANNGGYYSATGNTPPAAKFANAGDYIQVHFAGSPSLINYYLAGNSFSGGKFSVLESTDGISWDTLKNHFNLKSAYSLYSASLNAKSRYIKFLYVTKISGNVGLDDVLIRPGENSEPLGFIVKHDFDPIINGSEFIVGNRTAVELKIENTSSSLVLNGIKAILSGMDSADFSFSEIPEFINSQSSAGLTLYFKPSLKPGAKKALLTMSSKDLPNDSFQILLIAINGLYDTEPVNQPSALKFKNIKTHTLTVGIDTAGSGSQAFLVLKSLGKPLDAVPLDGHTYLTGDYIGYQQVAYVGRQADFVPTGIIANSEYHFAAFSFNGPCGYENYVQKNPCIGMVKTPGAAIGNYYSGIFSKNNTLLIDLQNRIKAQASQVLYSDYAATVIDNFASRDTVGGKKVLSCVYSGFNYVYSPPFKWGYMSREHTFAHSWMPNEAVDTDFYSDLFNLFPADQEHANMLRSNYPLGEVSTIYSQYLDAKFGLDASGKLVYEPRDSHKGDAARALFYMCVRYAGLNGLAWKLPPNSTMPYLIQDQDILKKWHFQDLPDDWEIARNEYVYSVQKNRNPFIDSINYACNIDFTNMKYIPSISLECHTNEQVFVEKNTEKTISVEVYPNPNNGVFALKITKSPSSKLFLCLTNTFGEILFYKQLNSTVESEVLSFQLPHLAKDIYHLSLYDESQILSKKIVVN